MRSHVVPIVALALIALPLCAQSNDVAVWFGRSKVGTTNSTGSSVHFDRGDSIGASWNHFFSGQLSTELAAFANHQYRIPFDGAGKKWVRFAAWDSAGNGAFTQPVHLR